MKLEVTALFAESSDFLASIGYSDISTGELELGSDRDRGVTVWDHCMEPTAYIFADSCLTDYFILTKGLFAHTNMIRIENWARKDMMIQLTETTIHELIHCIFAEDNFDDDPIHLEVRAISDELASFSISS